MTEYMYKSQLKSTQNKNELEEIQQLSKATKRKLDEYALDCIIIDSRPYNDFKKSGMLHFLSIAVPGYDPQHRQTIAYNVRNRFIEHQRMLANKLNKVDNIALTTDLWKNKHLEYFLCLTAHFFDKEHNLISIIIAFQKTAGRHSADNSKAYIQQELETYKIANKIRSITTDNASDMIKATKDSFGSHMSCLAHNLNLILKTLLKFTKPKRLKRYNFS
jgi:hypothetical protein